MLTLKMKGWKLSLSNGSHCNASTVLVLVIHMGYVRMEGCVIIALILNMEIVHQSLKCVNCNGHHKPTDRICPRYRSEEEALNKAVAEHITVGYAKKSLNTSKNYTSALKQQEIGKHGADGLAAKTTMPQRSKPSKIALKKHRVCTTGEKCFSSSFKIFPSYDTQGFGSLEGIITA